MLSDVLTYAVVAGATLYLLKLIYAFVERIRPNELCLTIG